MVNFKILYKLASRSRLSNFLKTVNNINTFAKTKDYLILVTADEDDTTMANLPILENTIVVYGKSGSKIIAINRDLELYPNWDILINMSDDMEFITSGFDKLIIEDFEKYGLDNLIHYPDNIAGERLITLSIMGKPYFERFGYIYHPAYKSLWCDNEQQEVAQKLGRYKLIRRRLFNHNHPSVGLAAHDTLSRHTESFFREDQRTFEQRKLKNFA